MENNEITILFKKYKGVYNEDKFMPYKVVSGMYDDKNQCFIDSEDNCYFHIINNPVDLGFCYRIDKNSLKKMYPLLPLSIAKSVVFFIAKRYQYQYFKEDLSNEQMPTILFYKDGNGDKNMLLDNDILSYYYENHIDAFKKKFKIVTPIDEMEEALEVENQGTNLDLYSLYKGVTEEVIDQDEPIMKIVTAVWKHYNDFSDEKSRNILINGSTGVGKTEIFRVLKKYIDIPYVIVDANDYTAAGYQGKNIEDMLLSLLSSVDGDLEKAEKGILIIDEVDKLSQTNSHISQVNQRDVQEALLKLLEDKVYNINYKSKNYSFNTSKLLVVCMGSWSRIDLSEQKVVGFGNKMVKKSYSDITREDIVKNGMIPEFVGRFPVLVQMNELNYDSFIKILKSKNSFINLNKKFFSKLGVELVFDDSAINAIAREADRNNYGARGLDEIIEKALYMATFEIGCCPGQYSELLVSEETIQDSEKYVLKKKNN